MGFSENVKLYSCLMWWFFYFFSRGFFSLISQITQTFLKIVGCWVLGVFWRFYLPLVLKDVKSSKNGRKRKLLADYFYNFFFVLSQVSQITQIFLKIVGCWVLDWWWVLKIKPRTGSRLAFIFTSICKGIITWWFSLQTIWFLFSLWWNILPEVVILILELI